MKSFVAYIMVFSLIGSVLCARHRRQAPAVGGAPPPPPGAADLEGAPGDLTTPGNTKVDGLNSAMGFILGDLNNQASMGVPLDPKKVDSVLKLALSVSVLGGEISDPNKEGIAGLATAPPLAEEQAAAGDAPAA